MGIFFVLVSISVLGIVAIVLLLKKEEQGQGVPLTGLDLDSDAPDINEETKEKASLLSKLGFGKKESKADPAARGFGLGKLERWPSLLNKIGLGRKKEENSEEEISDFSPLSSFKEHLRGQKPDRSKETTVPPDKDLGPEIIPAETGAGSTEGLGVSSEEEKKIEKEIELTAQFTELNEKYRVLDKLFKEKSGALETSEESLQNELKNRKEFNKVKDLLEKELKDAKEKARNIQVELASTKAESESYRNRINQLEEKCTKLEKQVMQKDDEVNNLVKRLQAFASPGTARVPPVAERVEVSAQEAIQEQPEVPGGGPDVQEHPGKEEPIQGMDLSGDPPTRTPEAEENASDEDPSGSGQEKEEFLSLRPDILEGDQAKPEDDVQGVPGGGQDGQEISGNTGDAPQPPPPYEPPPAPKEEKIIEIIEPKESSSKENSGTDKE